MAKTDRRWDKLFSEIAISHGLVTPAQIKAAMDAVNAQRAQGAKVTLGEVLVQQGVMTQTKHVAVERASTYKNQRRRDKILGRILIESDYCGKDPVLDQLKRQKAHYTKTGETRALVEFLLEDDALFAEQRTAAEKILVLKYGDA